MISSSRMDGPVLRSHKNILLFAYHNMYLVSGVLARLKRFSLSCLSQGERSRFQEKIILTTTVCYIRNKWPNLFPPPPLQLLQLQYWSLCYILGGGEIQEVSSEERSICSPRESLQGSDGQSQNQLKVHQGMAMSLHL